MDDGAGNDGVFDISVVIPVYLGERTVQSVVAELDPLTEGATTPAGVRFRVSEVILVYDNGPDRSDAILRRLEGSYPFVSVVWLSRNFGQHAATLAGMSASTGQWIVTMDEDGQHDPSAIGVFLDTAIEQQVRVVYASFTNGHPHGVLRSGASRSAKRILGSVFGTPDSSRYQSYRLVRGDVGRQLAGFAVAGVYLDVALSWVTNRAATVPVELRPDGDRASSYSAKRLLAYFWRMVLTSGTRALRIVSIIGAGFAVIGLGLAIYIVVSLLAGRGFPANGWASLMVIVLLGIGAVLASLGVIAEYIGVTLNVAMGRPLYLVADDPDPEPAPPGRSERKTDHRA